jgi:hypothetical protein
LWDKGVIDERRARSGAEPRFGRGFFAPAGEAEAEADVGHDYSEALAAEICERMAQGRSLKSICRDADMPANSTVFRWLARHADFARQYAAAREAQAQALFDEILAIADEAAETPNGVSKAKLMVDTRKWWLARVAPKTYGDRLDLDPASGAAAMSPQERQARITELLAKAERGA